VQRVRERIYKRRPLWTPKRATKLVALPPCPKMARERHARLAAAHRAADPRLA